MYKLAIGAIIIFLIGCTNSEEYYLSNINEAKETLKECYVNQEKGIRLDSSEDCLNAFHAVNKNKAAKAEEKSILEKELRLAKKRQKEEEIKAEMLKFTNQYKQLTGSKLYKIHERRECKGTIECKALKEVLTVKIKESIDKLTKEINGERAKLDSFDEFYKEACQGITKNEYRCNIIKEVDSQLLANAKIEHKKMIEFYLDNREKIKPVYLECHQIMIKAVKNGMNDTLYGLKAYFGYLPDDVYIKCNSLYDALRKLDIELNDGFTMSPSKFNNLLH